MVEVIHFAGFGVEVLDVFPGVDVSFELLDVVFDVFRLVGNGEVEGVVTNTKLKLIDAVSHASLFDKIVIQAQDDIVVRSWLENEGSWGLSRKLATFGRGRMPFTLHLLPSLIAASSLSRSRSLSLSRMY